MYMYMYCGTITATVEASNCFYLISTCTWDYVARVNGYVRVRAGVTLPYSAVTPVLCVGMPRGDSSMDNVLRMVSPFKAVSYLFVHTCFFEFLEQTRCNLSHLLVPARSMMRNAGNRVFIPWYDNEG